MGGHLSEAEADSYDSSRRRRDKGGSRERRDDRTKSRADEDPSQYSRRRRSREREHRRRSRSPDSKGRRSRSRDRERRRDADRERDRDRHRNRRGHGSADADSDHETRPRRRRDRGDDSDTTGRDRPRRRSPDSRHSQPRHLTDKDDAGRTEGNQSLVKHRGPLPSQGDSFALSNGQEPEKPVEKPNFGNTGVLAAASNSVAQADGSTITLKYHEPPEARKPPSRDEWKLFVFKGQDIVDTIPLSTRSCWLIGRELAVVDLPAEHPSISKQHAVIQFRYTEKRNEFGDKLGRVKPYLIDLESANGTMLNGDKIPDSRYLELRNKDMIQFGFSTREYVVMLAPKD